jgi:hypothetical protein
MKDSERKKAESIARTIQDMKDGIIPIPGVPESDAPQNGVNGHGSASPQPDRIQSSVPVPFYESITRAGADDGSVFLRVWRREEEFPKKPDAEVLGVIKRFTDRDNMITMTTKIAALPRITAIEVTDRNSNGVVVYLEW